MKLVKKNTGRPIIEFKDRSVKFHSVFLETVLKDEGVLIPPAMRSKFDGQEVIFVDHPLFETAFREVYWPFYMETAESSYEWKK